LKAPGYGDRPQGAMLEDKSAVADGGRAISKNLAFSSKTSRSRIWGPREEGPRSNKDKRVVIEGAGKGRPTSRARRIDSARTRERPATRQGKLGERIAKLSGGRAKINGGAARKAK